MKTGKEIRGETAEGSKQKLGEGGREEEMRKEDIRRREGESRRKGDKKGGEDWRKQRMRWDSNVEEKKGKRGKCRGEEKERRWD